MADKGTKKIKPSKEEEAKTVNAGGSVAISKPQFPLPTNVAAKIDRDHETIEHDTFADEFIQSVGKISHANIVSRLTNESQFIQKLIEEKASHTGLEIKTSLPSNTVQAFEGEGTFSSTSLKMCYSPPNWPHQVPLYKTLSKLPALRSLILDDSKISWLRELGSSLPNLVTLSVMRCGLKSLDGTLGLSNLENLFAADNLIDNPAPLSALSKLRYIDLSNNPINTFEGFKFLSVCSNLRCIKLMETKVSQSNDFHVKMRQMIPSLREIQPKTREVHGDSIFDFCNTLIGADENLESRTASREAGDAGLQETLTALNLDEALLEDDVEDEEPKLTEADVGYEWGEEERRLRDVYIPAKIDFHNRSGVNRTAPRTVDEMDALLDELENCQVGQNPLESISPSIDLAQNAENQFNKKYLPTIKEETEIQDNPKIESTIHAVPKEFARPPTEPMKKIKTLPKIEIPKPGLSAKQVKPESRPGTSGKVKITLPKIAPTGASKTMKQERPKLPTTLKQTSEPKKKPSSKK